MNAELLNKINQEVQNGGFGAICTVIDESGSTPRSRGASMWVRPDGTIAGTIGGGLIEYEAIQQALELMKSGETSRLWHKSLTAADGMVCGGKASVFIEVVGLGDELVIFGAGHCARALAPLLASVGFRVTVFDDREALADTALFPQAERVICGALERIADRLTLTRDDYVVSMTSTHASDLCVMRQVLAAERAYVGMLGGQGKRAFVAGKLREAGIPQARIDGMRTPVGLDIRAVTPEEIAVSIAAEMVLVRAQNRERAGREKPCTF